MRKLIFLSIFISSLAYGIDRYGGQYNVIPDTSPYTFNYRFYIDPGKTGVNNFEVRSMLDDIYAIWKATTALSECDRYRAVNVLLETRIDSYVTYPPGVFRSSVPWDSRDVVYYSTYEATALGMIPPADYNVKYSTIPICNEGQALTFK